MPGINQDPLFSVLIANHNDGKYLTRAIDSVLGQSYSNWEIVIVDDDSSDDSLILYKQYSSDNRIRIFYNDKNMGCGYTKRRCISCSRGNICGFLDADDALADDALEIMVKNHVDHPEASLIYSKYYKCNKNLNVEWVSTHQMTIPENSSFLECGHRGAISHFATFKKDSYDKTDGINPILKIAEDKDLYYKLEEVGSVIFVNKPLYYYRCNTGNNCSLEAHAQDATIWEFVARYEACKRRNKDVESVAFPLINSLIESVYKTRTYRIGLLIVKPIKLLKNIFAVFKSKLHLSKNKPKFNS